MKANRIWYSCACCDIILDRHAQIPQQVMMNGKVSRQFCYLNGNDSFFAFPWGLLQSRNLMKNRPLYHALIYFMSFRTTRFSGVILPTQEYYVHLQNRFNHSQNCMRWMLFLHKTPQFPVLLFFFFFRFWKWLDFFKALIWFLHYYFTSFFKNV